MTPSDASRQEQKLRDPQAEIVTPTGWRVSGEKAVELIGEPDSPDPALPIGAPDQVLYGAIFTAQPRADGPRNVAQLIREELRTDLRSSWPEAPRLLPDRSFREPPARFGGAEWDVHEEDGDWSGELTWRHPHPVVPGAPCTSQVILEERRYFTRIAVRVTADRGTQSVRGMVGAGHAHPEFIRRLARRLELIFHGAPVKAHHLPELEIDDLVESVLLSPDRETPIAVLAPLEDGRFAREADELVCELAGVAKLYVITNHDHTFRLTDAVRDKRLSCFYGALRIYLPGFSLADDHHAHPLLVNERLADPVMRAHEFGAVAAQLGREIDLPTRVRERGNHSGPDEPPGAVGDPAPGEVDPPSPDGSPVDVGLPDPHSPDAESAPGREQDRSDGTLEKRSQGGEGSTSDKNLEVELAGVEGSMKEIRTDIAALDQALRGFTDLSKQLLHEVTSMREAFREVTAELQDLRAISGLRASSTNSLERRLESMEDLLDRHLSPREEIQEREDLEAHADDEERSTREAEEDAGPTLPEVVRQAMERHPETLLFLDRSERSVQESPYVNPEEVGRILDIMAMVAKRRSEGSLSRPLREAFRDLGVDYRAGISATTSSALREQYIIPGPDGQTYDCVEHIAMGKSFDPRYCLRIYFTSRVPAESRFVIGHVGRHFKLENSN